MHDGHILQSTPSIARLCKEPSIFAFAKSHRAVIHCATALTLRRYQACVTAHVLCGMKREDGGMVNTMDANSLNQPDAGMPQSANQDMPLQEDIQQSLDPLRSASSNDPSAELARDPVCGMLVEKRTATNTLASPVNTQLDILYFHSPECKAIFEQDPQKYGYNF